MRKLLLSSILLLSVTGAYAQGNKNDKLPNGQPFQNLQVQVDATNAALEATNQAQSATEAALQAADSALQARDVVLQQGIDSTNAAQQAAVAALGAADEALKARDNLLQDQIDLINMTLNEQLALINLNYNLLEQQIAAVGRNSAQGDDLLEQQIELVNLAVDTLSGRVDAIEDLNHWQDLQIQLLTSRINGVEQTSNAHMLQARQDYTRLGVLISDAMARANSAYNLASQTYTNDQSSYSSLQYQLDSAMAQIGRLDNHLNEQCMYGYYVVGVNYEGDLICRELTDVVSVTTPLTKYRYCVESTGGDPGDFFYVCWDYKYYQYGTAYCPGGYERQYESYSTPGGLNYINRYATSAYLRTSTTDGEQTNTGWLKITCALDVDTYVHTPGY